MRPLIRLQEGLLRSLWFLVSRFPAVIVATGIGVAAISILLALAYLQLDSDQNSLVSSDLAFHKRYLQHLQNFGDQEYFYVVIRTGGTEEGKQEAEQFAEQMARELRRHPQLIQTLYYKISAKDFGDGTLLFATPAEAKALSDMVVYLAPYLNAWMASGNLADFIDMIARLLAGENHSPVEVDPSLFGQGLGMLRYFLENLHDCIAGKADRHHLLQFGDAGTHYFFTSNGHLLIMRILPVKDFQTLDVVQKPLKAVRQALQATRVEFPNVQAGLTGRPVLQADEMQTTDKDMTRASVAAIVLVGLLFVFVLRGWLRPVLLVASLIIAIIWTFGFVTISIGQLNLLSIVFTLVLVGIGVDFGVHIMLRYVENRKNGSAAREAVQTSIFRTGPGIIMGALTSVCAFYSVLGSDFRGLAELGLVGGTGILLSLLTMLTFLPAMLLMTESTPRFSANSTRVVAYPFLERMSARPLRLLLILAAASIAAVPGLFKLHFSYNLLELQAKGLESVEYEGRLITESDESTWYAIMTTDSPETINALVSKVKNLPSVGKVESILDFIPKAQEQKIALYAKAVAVLDEITTRPPQAAVPDASAMVDALDRLTAALEGIEERLFAAGATQEMAVLNESMQSIQASRAILEHGGAEKLRLQELQQELNHDIEESLEQLKRLLSAKSVTPKDIPASIRDLFIGKDGSYQIKVSPRDNVWNFDKLRQFVADLRKVDPTVSGVPVGVMESAQLMHRTFLSAAGLTIILVSLMLWLYSRSLVYVVLTLLPLGVGILWLLELMGWAGINFNLANFFAVPILIAIGVDGGVHFLARWGELQGHEGLFSTSTPTAVSLSFTTTMVGFGGLLFAHHRGLASLGAVMVLGSLTGLVSCLLVLPAVLKLIKQPQSRAEGAPTEENS